MGLGPPAGISLSSFLQNSNRPVQTDWTKTTSFPLVNVELLVNKPSIRMYILMLDTRNEEQTNDVRMYIEEFILVDIWIHCCTKLELNMHWKCSSLYTLTTKE